MTRFLSIITFFCIYSTLSIIGFAQSSTPNTSSTHSVQDSKEEPNGPYWSIGAGLGFGSFQIDPLSSVSLGSRNIQSPIGAVLVERQITRQLHLLLRLVGSYTNRDEDRNETNYRSSEIIDKIFGVNAAAGFRWLFNPGGVVEFSGTVTIGALWHYEEGDEFNSIPNGETGIDEDVYLDFNTVTYSLGGTLGLVLERRLLESLYLRLESSFLGSYYGQKIHDYELPDGSRDSTKFKLFNIGMVFSPMIELRLLI